jgi:hypothetical protein
MTAKKEKGGYTMDAASFQRSAKRAADDDEPEAKPPKKIKAAPTKKTKAKAAPKAKATKTSPTASPKAA